VPIRSTCGNKWSFKYCWNTRSYGAILTFWLLLLGGYLEGGRWKLYWRAPALPALWRRRLPSPLFPTSTVVCLKVDPFEIIFLLDSPSRRCFSNMLRHSARVEMRTGTVIVKDRTRILRDRGRGGVTRIIVCTGLGLMTVIGLLLGAEICAQQSILVPGIGAKPPPFHALELAHLRDSCDYCLRHAKSLLCESGLCCRPHHEVHAQQVP